MVDWLQFGIVAIAVAIVVNLLFVWLGFKYVSPWLKDWKTLSNLRKGLLLLYFILVPLTALVFVGSGIAVDFWKLWRGKG